MSIQRLLSTLVVPGVAGAMCVLLSGVLAYGGIRFIYDGVDDLGGGNYQYNYHGERDALPETDVEDLHVEGKLVIDPGQVNLLAPGDWAGHYDGLIYSWTINEQAQPWTASTPELYGFAIQVAYPTVQSTPFHWTTDRQDPLAIVPGGEGSGVVWVPSIPEPATVVLICIAAGLLGLRRNRRK